jgi:hypothetical protein
MVRTILFLLPLLFAWLKLSHLSLSEIAQSISDASASDFIWKSALILYFFAWGWGTLWDVNIQERVYLEAPDKGKMPFNAVAIAAGIFCVGAILVWVDTFVAFVGALALFTIVDHFAWRYLIQFLRPMIQMSRTEYSNRNDLIGLEQLRLVEFQICGVWKWWRGAMGALLIVAMMILALAVPPELPIRIGQTEVSLRFVEAASILVWVLAMEAWHWYVRVVTRVAVDVLEDIRDKYQLVPR